MGAVGVQYDDSRAPARNLREYVSGTAGRDDAESGDLAAFHVVLVDGKDERRARVVDCRPAAVVCRWYASPGPPGTRDESRGTVRCEGRHKFSSARR
jgi:hypothetical protein